MLKTLCDGESKSKFDFERVLLVFLSRYLFGVTVSVSVEEDHLVIFDAASSCGVIVRTISLVRKRKTQTCRRMVHTHTNPIEVPYSEILFGFFTLILYSEILFSKALPLKNIF